MKTREALQVDPNEFNNIPPDSEEYQIISDILAERQINSNLFNFLPGIKYAVNDINNKYYGREVIFKNPLMMKKSTENGWSLEIPTLNTQAISYGVSENNIYHVNIDNLSNEDLIIMSKFFTEQELEKNKSMMFDDNRYYKFNSDNYICFNKKIIGYEKENKNTEMPEWIYVTKSDISLGRGAFGEVSRVEGKLVHKGDGSMRYIKPDHTKSDYLIKLMTVDDINLLDVNVLRDLSQNKFPILMKDKDGHVCIFGRKENSWLLTTLNESIFNGVKFPEDPKQPTKPTQIDEIGDGKIINNVINELNKGHTRRQKVIKISRNSNEEDLKNEVNVAIAMGQSAKRPTKGIRESAMIMDQAKGHTLKKILDSNQNNLSDKDRLDISIALIMALKKYHDAGYIHYDIKPENIIVDENIHGYQVSIIDHGLARSKEGPLHSSMVGTHAYISPEMITFVKGCPKEETDVYSMGQVLRLVFGDNAMIDEVINAPNLGPSFFFNKGSNPVCQLDINDSVKSEILLQVMKIVLSGMTTNADNRLKLDDILTKLIEVRRQMQNRSTAVIKQSIEADVTSIPEIQNNDSSLSVIGKGITRVKSSVLPARSRRAIDTVVNTDISNLQQIESNNQIKTPKIGGK